MSELERYMTAEQIEASTERLRELDRKKLLPEETIRLLWRWWLGWLRKPEHHKVINFPRRAEQWNT